MQRRTVFAPAEIVGRLLMAEQVRNKSQPAAKMTVRTVPAGQGGAITQLQPGTSPTTTCGVVDAQQDDEHQPESGPLEQHAVRHLFRALYVVCPVSGNTHHSQPTSAAVTLDTGAAGGGHRIERLTDIERPQ